MNHEGPGTRLTARSTKSKDTNLSYKLQGDFFSVFFFIDFQRAFKHMTGYLVKFFFCFKISCNIIFTCTCMQLSRYPLL